MIVQPDSSNGAALQSGLRDGSPKQSDATIRGGNAPGVIAAVHSYREQDTVPKAGQVGWNVVAFEQYKAFRGGLSDQAIQDDIEWTKSAVDDVECGKAVVMALLCTDIGKGAAFILIDHKTSVGNKNIVAIYTRRQEGSWVLPDGSYL
ncbi:hypothetical protein GGX14DRAFT_405714 [Mycena pura]|uniref:Uncharacterized protein n=1 Tax=Mycena pura TaxID=153505 RepID=A0AAD6Y260_9AGAR|nr:hypothetical protein GGX14DRAFT_405714 [Mycena pura]